MFVILILTLIIMNVVSSRFETIDVFSDYNDFKVKDGTIIDCGNSSGNIVIPKTVNGVSITRIDDYACDGLNIDSVYIPNSILSIGNYAFANNNIENLKIPDSVLEIGEGAFIHNKISSLDFSSSLKLGNACFNDNQLDYEDAFFYNDNKLISYGGSVRGNVLLPDIPIIGELAFFDTYIVSVDIPNSVLVVEESAFKNNYLVEIYLSSNVKNVSKTAFSNNPYLTTIVVESDRINLVDYPWGAEYSNLYLLK
jgi:hypothetical protein